MPSTISDARRRIRKLVTLPSGIEIEIRKVRLMDFVGLGELPFPSSQSKTSTNGDAPPGTLSRQEIESYSNRAIVAGCVDPPFSDRKEDETRDDVLHVRDLDQADWDALINQIFKWSGMAPEVAADADKFRGDEIGESRGRAGGKIREATDGDSNAHAGRGLPESGDSVPGEREDEGKK